MSDKYLLLSGGGFDSISVMVLYPDLIGAVVGVDYGQKASDGERISNAYFSRKYGLYCSHVMGVDFSQLITAHSLLMGGPDNFVQNGKWLERFEGDRFECRNLYLLSVATILACARGFDGVVTGFHRDSTDKFPDALPGFYSAFSRAVGEATRQPVKFWAPLQERGLGRVDVLLESLRVDPEVWYAYTCYGEPETPVEGSILETVPCRRCVHCFKRKDVKDRLRAAGYSGPLPLATLGHVELPGVEDDRF